MSEIREELKYTEDHEWVRIEDGVATVGITDFAQKELGDIVYVECDVAVGEEVSQGDTFGTIEAVKTVSDLFSPVSGEVVDINDELEGDPEQVNQEPYDKGWIIKIKIDNEPDDLLDCEAYKSLVE